MMREFFRGWKRKLGTATLAIALASMCGWVRCQRLEDGIQISIANSDHLFTSADGGVRWSGTVHEWWYHFLETNISWDVRERPAPLTLSLVMGGGQTIEGDFHFDIGFLPYWSIVSPLTLLSAYLLLSKPRLPNSDDRYQNS